MCKNHGKLHYSPWARNLASVIAVGDADLRDALLELATYDGLAAFLDKHSSGISSDRLTICVRMLKPEFERLQLIDAKTVEELWHTWGDELDTLLSLPPWEA